MFVPIFAGTGRAASQHLRNHRIPVHLGAVTRSATEDTLEESIHCSKSRLDICSATAATSGEVAGSKLLTMTVSQKNAEIPCEASVKH